MNNNTQKIKEQISAYIDGELSQEETFQVEDLILNNKQWQQYYKELQGLQNVLSGWEDEEVSLDLSHKVQKSLLEQKLKEDKIMKKPSFRKQIAPVLTITTCVIVGLLAMQVYVKKGTQGRLRQAADDIGDQYSVGKDQVAAVGSVYQPYTQYSAEVRERDASQYAASQPINREESAQYEPYYLSSDYTVDRKENNKKSGEKFASGLTQSQLLSGEAVTGVDRSEAIKVDQQFWGRDKLNHQPAQMAMNQKTQRGRAGFQQSVYPTSVPVERRIASLDEVVGYHEGDALYSPYPQDKDFHTENYNRIYENEFLTVDENPLSTFSIDVDTASYANVRRFLNQGQLPPKDSVRIEEMVNYFSYNYPQPKRGDPFSVTLKASTAPWNTNHQLVMIGLQGMTLQPNEIPPSNLVFLIDVSGSMNQHNKLPLLKEAFKMMVNQLGSNERVAIVVYAGAAGEVLSSTPGSNKQAILAAIDNLSAGGSTAGGAGIQLAYKIAKQNFIKGGNNRVILATDGDFNVGVSNDGALTRMIEEKRKDGIFLTTLGFGTGNYKDSRMEQIANKGNGNHYYIDTSNEARKVLVRELGSTLFTIAKDVKLQIEFNPQQVKAYRLIGYENRMLKKEDFNDDTKDAGELGAGHTVTALYEIVPAGSAESFGNVDSLKYQQKQINGSDELLTVKLRYKKPNENKSKLIQESIRMKEIHVTMDEDFAFASAVTEFGLLLRDSKFKANANFASILQRANQARGNDPFGYRAEFLHLVQQASRIMPQVGIDFKESIPQPAHEGEGGMFFKGSQNQ